MTTGPSSSQSPFILAAEPNVRFTSIMTVGDSVNLKPDGVTPYRMIGIPDGLGAFDNGNGTFTLLMNHEIVGNAFNLSGQQVGTADGIVRAHGAKGSTVSEWIINKSDLSVVSVQDAITSVRLWDRFDADADGDANVDWLAASPFSISRLCSADLAPVSAYQWIDDKGTVSTADDVVYGTAERIFLTGEEFSPVRDNPATAGVNEEVLGGREFAYVATGADKGTAFELAHFGYFAWENAVSSPFAQKKTINISMDDGLNGQVYVYVGEKQTTGNAVERAGLTDGVMYGIKVTNLLGNAGNESDALAASGRFELALEDGPKSPGGDISLLTGIELDDLGESKGVTSFLRPEDGQFDPTNPNVFWFVTTASFTGQSRLYKLTFDDITNPETGGTIEAVLSSSDLPNNGTTGPRMMDNMTVNADGKILIQEDVGNNAFLGRVLEYDPATDTVTVLGTHDANRFITGAPGFLTQDEESSGIIEAPFLSTADSTAYLLDVQAHQNLRVIDPELVENGQLLVMYVDEVKDGGAGDDRVAGDAGNNRLNGNLGNDEVLGGSGNDILFGARGNDVLDGGRGSDVLQGGLDNDTFIITVTNGDVDYITDFKPGLDVIEFGDGVTVVSASVQRVVATEANGFDLDNSDRALDLTLVLSNGSATQTLHILDAYAFANNGYWETTLGIDLTYPRPLPTGNDSVLISGLPIA